MDSIHPQTNDGDWARVTLLSPTVIELSFAGHQTRAAYERTVAEVDALIAANPQAQSLLWTVLDLTGYDPGNSAFTMRWLARQTRVRRSAVHTRSQVISALANVGRVMIPGLEVQAFRSRDEALAWLATPFVGRPRARSSRGRPA